MNKQLIKILPLTNPNFNMLNTADELIELLKHENFIICGEYPSENIVGFVDPKSNFEVIDEWIYGNIITHDNKSYEWINAEGQIKDDELVDNCGKFDKITAIYVKEIK